MDDKTVIYIMTRAPEMIGVMADSDSFENNPLNHKEFILAFVTSYRYGESKVRYIVYDFIQYE